MEKKQFYKLTLFTVIPLMVQSLFTSCVNFIDQIMVGELGVAEIAAVGAANKIYSLYYLVLYGTCCACVMFVSQYWGRREIDGVRKIMGMTCSVTISLGIIVTIATALFPQQCLSLFTDDVSVIESGVGYLRTISASYLLLSFIYPINYLLRGTANVKIILCSSSLSVIMNIIANYLFIFGNFGMPELGVVGAAVGTVITRAVELGVLVVYLIATKNKAFSSPKVMFSFNKTNFVTFIKKALPLAGNEFLWGVGTTLYFIIYGHMGTDELAAMSIVNTIQTMTQTFSLSLASSAAVIIGNEIGKNNMGEMFVFCKRFHRIAICLGAVTGVIMLCIIHPIVALYQLSGTTTGTYLAQCLVVLSILLPLNCYNSMNTEGLFRSGGDVRFVLLIDMGGIWMIGMPITFLFGQILGLPILIVYCAFVFVEIYKFIIGTKRYRSKRWLHKLSISA